MPESKSNRKLYWILQLSGWAGMVCIELINYTFFIVGKFDWGFALLFGYGALLGLVLTHLFRLLVIRSTVFERRPRTIWMLAFVSTLVISILMNVFFYLPSIIRKEVELKQLFSFIGILGGTINWMRYVGVWVILYFMYHILERTRKIEEDKLRSENVARVTELELLKAQLNPHFLFNALNSIKALVSIDQEKSKDAIVKLSELLRFTLHYGDHALIPLRDELEEVEKYLSLEQIRFGSRLRVHFNVEDAALNGLIPPALVLTMAENAIKHGVAKQSGECDVIVSAKKASSILTIEMSNPGSFSESGRQGIGLQNIRKRLYHFFGDRSSFVIGEKGGKVVASIIITEL